MFKEWFRGVIWPRKSKDKLYRYVIIGMIVTEKPISNLDKNQYIFNGNAFGLSDIIEHVAYVEDNRPLGDASDVLLRLDDLI